MAAVQFDIGILITAIAAVLAFGRGWDRRAGRFNWRRENGRPGWMRHVLLVAWATGAIATLADQPMSAVVFLTTVMDFVIAGVAVVVSMNDPTRVDARTTGVISLALMPAHLTVSANNGLPASAWTLYAAACNGAFVVQCLITGGWLDGVGRSIDRFLGRLRRLPLLRFRGR
jgi:hypothetical protein